MSVLPDIEMPPSPQDEVPNPLSAPEPDLDTPKPDTPKPEVVLEEDVDVSKLESMVGDITMPPPPPEPEPLKVKQVLEDEAVFKDVKPRKKSQKQLDHLARAREKALQVRREKSAAKKQVAFAESATQQDPRPKENKESVILHMSVAEFQKMTEQSNLKAVESYDTKRKAQKRAKKEVQEEFNKANQVNKQINKALGVPDPDDIWAQCFQ